RFETEYASDQKLPAIEGALGMPGFQLQPGQTYSARFEIYAGPKLYHRLAQLPHNEAEVMDFGIFKLVCQFLLNFMNLLHSWLGDLSQPDTIAHLPLLGWPVNIIPLCMAATQIWLMAMTPKTGDATQRRVMMFTPLIFLFICYNFAAALALYYTAQNLFSILQ